MDRVTDAYTVSIKWKEEVDEQIFEQEKRLLLQFAPDLYVEMQKYLDEIEE